MNGNPWTVYRSTAALVLLVPAPTIGTAAAMILTPGPKGQVIFLLAKVWLFLLPAIWHTVLEKGKPSLSKPMRGGFGTATILGVVMAVVIVVAYWTIGQRWVDAQRVRQIARHSGVDTRHVYLAMAVYWITVNSLLEEYVWRWFVVQKCRDLMTTHAAVVCSAAFFTAHHVIALRAQFDWATTMLASAGVFVGGASWSWLYVRFGSIWPCYVSHAITDIPIFVIGYVMILH